MKLASRTLAAGLGIVLFASLSACTQSTSPPDESNSSEKTLTIGYITAGPFEYYNRGIEGAEAAQSDLNVKIQAFNSDSKPEKEIANVEDAIAQGVDGLIIFSVGKSSLEADLAKANAANIPAVVLYGYDPAIESQAVAFIQAPTDVTGKQAGKWMADNVDSGDIAIIQGLLGRGDAESYTEGFMTAVKANTSLKVVATPAADWDRAKAQAAMADVLTAHPDLVGVFVQNEDMALGAAAAVKAAGLSGQVMIVAQNGSPAGLDAVSDNTLAATVAWSPAQEAQMALKRLVSFLRTGTATEPVLCNTPTVIVSKDNIGDAVPWAPTADSTKIGLAAACGN